MPRERLKKLLDALPLDRLQRQAADEGIKHLSDQEVIEIADELEKAFDELPAVIKEFNDLIRDYEKSNKP